MNELNVITVPALDWDGQWHTAFTVYSEADGILRTSSGWTLRDAERLILRHRAQLSLVGLNMLRLIEDGKPENFFKDTE